MKTYVNDTITTAKKTISFNALSLMVGSREDHLVCKTWCFNSLSGVPMNTFWRPSPSYGDPKIGQLNRVFLC